MLSHLTIIWLASQTLFGRYLLGRLWAYGGQTWQGGAGWSQKRARENEILKFQSVAMETRKFSHTSGISLMVLNFSGWNLLCHSNVPAKNEQNLPYGFRETAPLATGWQPNQDEAWWRHAWRHSRAWRHRARRVARNVILTSDRSAPKSWACQIFNF